MEKCREFNLVVSPKKFEISEETKYAGSLISSQGIRPNPAFITAISALAPPTSQTQVRALLGMAQQLAGYTDKLAQVTQPLRELLHKGISFGWNSLLQKSFEDLKKLLCGPLVLHYFNPSLPPIVITDASTNGIGFVCIQYEKEDKEQKFPKLIAAGSRGLTPSESRFSTCELETLSVVYSLTKLHHFLANAPIVHLWTDHKSILGIWRKDISQLENKRLQNLRLKTLHINLEIKHIAGIKNQISDYLSRNPVFQPILKENSLGIGEIYPSGDQNDQKKKAKPFDATSLEK